MNKDKQSKNAPIWEKYIGKEVGIFDADSPIVMGRMSAPNLETNTVEFLPVMANEPDDRHMHLETKVPLTMGLGIFKRESLIIRPFRDGYIEERVQQLNRYADKAKASMGFKV